jgi:hypothetical protein
LDLQFQELFTQLERYIAPLARSDIGQSFSKDENKILALQCINRLNQRIGLVARSIKDETGELKLLQTYVNNITVGIKNDNSQLVKSAMASTKSIIAALEHRTG